MENIKKTLETFPKGIKLYSFIQGESRFLGIREGKIVCEAISTGKEMRYDQFGRAILPDGSVSVSRILFPTKHDKDYDYEWEHAKAYHGTKFNVGDLVVPVGVKFPVPVVVKGLVDFEYKCDKTKILYSDEDNWRRFRFNRGSDIVFESEPKKAYKIDEISKDGLTFSVKGLGKWYSFLNGKIKYWSIQDANIGDLVICHGKGYDSSFYTIFCGFNDNGDVLGLGRVHRYTTITEERLVKNLEVFSLEEKSFDPGYDEDMNIFKDVLFQEGLKFDKSTLKIVEMPKFDLNSLKAFDQVLVRRYRDLSDSCVWQAELFSHYSKTSYGGLEFKCVSKSDNFACCVPYNDDTKHLVGTKKRAPEFYITWSERV